MAISETILGMKVIFTGEDKMSNVIANVNKTVKVLQSDFAQAMTVMQVFGSVANGLSIAGRGMIRFLKSGTDAFREFEAQVLFTTKVISDTTEPYRRLSDDILKLAGEVPIATQELAKLSTVTAQMGFRGKQIGDVMKVTSRTMLATGIETEKIALLFGGLRNAFGKKSIDAMQKFDKNLEAIASTLVFVGNATAGNAKQVAEASLRFAGVASQFGFAAEEIFAFASSIIDLQFKPARAGSAMAKLLGRMQANAEEFARVGKINVNEFKMAVEAASNGTEKASNVVLVWLKAMQTAKIPATEMGKEIRKLVGGHEVLTNIVLSLVQNVDELNKRSKAAAEAFAENKALSTALQIQLSSLDAQLVLLDNKWMRLKITMAETLKPILVPIIKAFQDLVDAANKMSPEWKRFSAIMMVVGAVILIIMAKLFLLGIAFNSIGIAVAVFKSALVNLWAFIKLFSTTIGVWTLGIVALVGVIILVSRHWDKFVAGIRSSELFDSVGAIFSAFNSIAGSIGEIFISVINKVREIFGLTALESGSGIKALGVVVGVVLQVVAGLLQFIAGLIHVLVPVAENAIELFQPLLSLFGGIFTAISGLVSIISGDFDNGVRLLYKGFWTIGKAIALLFITPLRFALSIIRTMVRVVLRAVSLFGKLLGFNTKALDDIDKALSNKGISGDFILEKNVKSVGGIQGEQRTGGIIPFAEGGMVTKPTLGLVGEAGPELITPVSGGSNPNDNLMAAINHMSSKISMMVEQLTEQNENAEINIPITINIDGKKLSKSASLALSDAIRNGDGLSFGFHGVG